LARGHPPYAAGCDFRCGGGDDRRYFLMLQQPTDWRRVAGLLVQPLEAVYGAAPHTELTIKVFETGR